MRIPTLGPGNLYSLTRVRRDHPGPTFRRPRPLRAQPQDNPTAANGRPRPAARAYNPKEAGPGARRSTCVGGACAEGADEKAGKGGMERQGVRGACFLRAAAGGQGTAAISSFRDVPEAGCLSPVLLSGPPLACPGPDFLTDRLGPDRRTV